MGLNLKIKRIEKGIKQYELAEKAGISPQYLRKIESGETVNPSKKVMLNIAKELNATVNELFFS